MPINETEKERLNLSMPVANDVKLGDIIQDLQENTGGNTSIAWGEVTGKPSTFPPSTHTHNGTQVTVSAISGVTGSNVQTVLESLAAKIAALEGGGA